jgi:hypothetical protein
VTQKKRSHSSRSDRVLYHLDVCHPRLVSPYESIPGLAQTPPRPGGCEWKLQVGKVTQNWGEVAAKVTRVVKDSSSL